MSCENSDNNVSVISISRSMMGRPGSSDDHVYCNSPASTPMAANPLKMTSGQKEEGPRYLTKEVHQPHGTGIQNHGAYESVPAIVNAVPELDNDGDHDDVTIVDNQIYSQ